VAAFNREMITAIIHTGQFTDPSVEPALVNIMLKRRDKILRAYLPAVNPVVAPRLRERELVFDNAAVNADVARAPRLYTSAWFEFDNATRALRPLGESSSPTTSIEAPAALPNQMGSFVAIDIAADGTDYASWRRPVRAYFRRQPEGWTLVGLDREPDGNAGQVASLR